MSTADAVDTADSTEDGQNGFVFGLLLGPLGCYSEHLVLFSWKEKPGHVFILQLCMLPMLGLWWLRRAKDTMGPETSKSETGRIHAMVRAPRVPELPQAQGVFFPFPGGDDRNHGAFCVTASGLTGWLLDAASNAVCLES